MSKRDTSGLWADADATAPDRSIGVAPPPRSKRIAAVPATAAPTPPPTTTSPPQQQDREQQDPQPPSEVDQDSDVKLLALSFTADQMDWLRKTSSKRDVWTGELFEELFYAHKVQVAAAGTPRRTRRRNANYTGTRVQVSIAAFNDFAALAAELRTSRAALGRAVIDAERL